MVWESFMFVPMGQADVEIFGKNRSEEDDPLGTPEKNKQKQNKKLIFQSFGFILWDNKCPKP